MVYNSEAYDKIFPRKQEVKKVESLVDVDADADADDDADADADA